MSGRDDVPRAHREPHRPYDPAKSAERRNRWEPRLSKARDDNRIAKGRRADNIRPGWL